MTFRICALTFHFRLTILFHICWSALQIAHIIIYYTYLFINLAMMQLYEDGTWSISYNNTTNIQRIQNYLHIIKKN